MEHAEDWEVYPTTIQNEFAMVAVDLSLKNQAPIQGLDRILWFRVAWETEGDSPIPTAERMEVLDSISAWIGEEVETIGGIVASRITFQGRREVFVYVSSDVSDAFMSGAQLRFPDEDFEAKVQPDEDWTVYLEFLYPDVVQFHRIQNQRTVRLLGEQGDALQVPRKVEHTAVFHSEEARDEFGAFLIDNGFEVRTVEHEEAAERPFGVVGIATHPVDLRSIDGVTMSLFSRIRELGGQYDGWGCAVMKVN